MNSFRSILHSRARVTRFVLPVVALCVGSLAADAQTPTPPYALFQNSTITGFGNTLNIGWLPIQLSSGLLFKNVTITFDVDSSGNLTIAQGFPQSTAAPPIPVSEFVTGTYVATSIASNATIVVNGPGVTSAPVTVWSISLASGASCATYPANATWYVGAPAGLPLLPRLEAAGMSSTAWSYGIGAGPSCLGAFPGGNNLLLGFMQVGNSITIANFTDGLGKDHNQPVATVTYTLSQ